MNTVTTPEKKKQFFIPCNTCRGKKVVACIDDDGGPYSEDCPACDGTGNGRVASSKKAPAQETDTVSDPVINIPWERPKGIADGINSKFVLSYAPIDRTLHLKINGLLMEETVDYWLNKDGNEILILAHCIPQHGDFIDVKYNTFGPLLAIIQNPANSAASEIKHIIDGQPKRKNMDWANLVFSALMLLNASVYLHSSKGIWWIIMGCATMLLAVILIALTVYRYLNSD